MESDKLNWANFGEYMNGESTAPCDLDDYLEKIFVRHVRNFCKFSSNNYTTGETTTFGVTTGVTTN